MVQEEKRNIEIGMERFKVIGYYICEIIDAPEWLREVGKQVLSVSDCIGEQHPKCECFMGGWHKGESQEYQDFLKLKDAQYREFSDAANHLFNLKQIDVDGRFLRFSDAQYFHKKFCSAINSRVVSVSTTPKYFEILTRELKDSNSHGLMSGNADDSSWMGSDILGWDISGFHSFLCNSLQTGLSRVKFNDVGLLQNDFHDVISYAERIKGLGGPVEWIPCRIGIHE